MPTWFKNKRWCSQNDGVHKIPIDKPIVEDKFKSRPFIEEKEEERYVYSHMKHDYGARLDYVDDDNEDEDDEEYDYEKQELKDKEHNNPWVTLTNCLRDKRFNDSIQF